MVRSAVWLAVIAAVGSLGATAARGQGLPPGAEQADVHNPFSPGYVDMTPGNGASFYYFDGSVPYGLGWNYGWGYDPYYWPPYYDPIWPGPIVYPPLVLPAETMYGPQALRRFAGLDQPAVNPAGPGAAPAGGGFGNGGGRGDQRGAANRPHPSNAQSLARSRQYLVLGDEYFQQQQYSSAYQRYKKASNAAPDTGEPWFRQGHALMAMGRYDMAANAYKRGLGVEPDWADSPFRLNELYGGNALAKTAHFEALATAATQDPGDGDLMFLLGVMLHFDDQQERARTFFLRAGELAPGDHLEGFLAQPIPEGDPGREL